MNRRELLKGAAGMLGTAVLPPFLRPGSPAPWGAIDEWLPTHQFIVERAMRLLAQDPLWQYFRIPGASEITNRDFVETDVVGLTGSGPDVPGNSRFSWHYFNPVTQQGLAPAKVGDYFEEMMVQRLQSADQTWGAAWAAHFLSDMFVPYHTFGLPASEVDHWRRGLRWIMTDEICGDFEIMYSLFQNPDSGWGWAHDHTDSVAVFRAQQQGKHGADLDWFDPWYWNGYLVWPLRDASGSHQTWELRAWQGPEFTFFSSHHHRIQAESWYDPLWENRKPAFGDRCFANQSEAGRAYAAACAQRTRNNTVDILHNPSKGIAMAIRGVLTLYRASMTSLGLSGKVDPSPDGGHTVVATVQNRHPWAQVQELDLRLSLDSQTGSQTNVFAINGSLAPGQIATATWNVSNDSQATGTIEASGRFLNAPDLGYSRLGIQLEASRARQPESEHRQPEPERDRESMTDPEVLRAWEGEWQTEYQWGHDWGWRPGEGALRIVVDGETVTLIRTGMQPSKGELSEGGRCITSVYSAEGFLGSMKFCLDPGGNSFQGRVTMRTREEVLQPRVRGQRIR